MHDAFKFAEKEKAITLLSYLNENQAMNYANVPDTLIKYDDIIRERVLERMQQLDLNAYSVLGLLSSSFRLVSIASSNRPARR